MRKLGAVLVLVAAIALAGCVSQSAGEAARPAASATPPSSEVAAAPITSSPEAKTSSAPAVDEASYLVGIKAFWRGQLPSDSDLVGAGQSACDSIRAGTAPSDVVAVIGDDEDAISNNGRVTTSATQYLCPEFF